MAGGARRRSSFGLSFYESAPTPWPTRRQLRRNSISSFQSSGSSRSFRSSSTSSSSSSFMTASGLDVGRRNGYRDEHCQCSCELPELSKFLEAKTIAGILSLMRSARSQSFGRDRIKPSRCRILLVLVSNQSEYEKTVPRLTNAALRQFGPLHSKELKLIPLLASSLGLDLACSCCTGTRSGFTALQDCGDENKGPLIRLLVGARAKHSFLSCNFKANLKSLRILQLFQKRPDRMLESENQQCARDVFGHDALKIQQKALACRRNKRGSSTDSRKSTATDASFRSAATVPSSGKRSRGKIVQSDVDRGGRAMIHRILLAVEEYHDQHLGYRFDITGQNHRERADMIGIVAMGDAANLIGLKDPLSISTLGWVSPGCRIQPDPSWGFCSKAVALSWVKLAQSRGHCFRPPCVEHGIYRFALTQSNKLSKATLDVALAMASFDQLAMALAAEHTKKQQKSCSSQVPEQIAVEIALKIGFTKDVNTIYKRAANSPAYIARVA